MGSPCFNLYVLDSVTLAKLLVARQDSLAQAEESRHAALEREQHLITEVAQTKHERDSLSHVGFSLTITVSVQHSLGLILPLTKL